MLFIQTRSICQDTALLNHHAEHLFIQSFIYIIMQGCVLYSLVICGYARVHVCVCTHCIYRHLWIYPYVCIGTTVHMNVKTRSLHWMPFPSLSIIVILLRQVSHWKQAHQFSQVGWPRTSGMCLSLYSPPPSVRHVPPHMIFKWVPEIWTQGSMLVQEAPYWLSNLPSLYSLGFNSILHFGFYFVTQSFPETIIRIVSIC